MFRIHPSIPRVLGRRIALLKSRSQLRFAAAKSYGRQKGTSNFWSQEKLQTDERYPLSLVLNDILHPNVEPKIPGKKQSKSAKSAKSYSPGVHVRTQIVSPDLCDDVLKYIGHTLEKYKGYDILDINPGAGLWSQKLHEYLQPRSHVLLEPHFDKFKDFLDPLLTAPDSKYTLVTKDPCALSTYREMVDDGAFPHQISRDTEDPQAQEPNNTLLVTGSLVWDPKLPGYGFDSMAKQLFHHFASAAWTNDMFHIFGSVRMLLWVQHDDFNGMIAEAAAGMQRANRFLEMALDMSVVVNAERTARKTGKGSTGREPQYEIESTVRALKAGREKGMELPPHRRDYIHAFAEDIEKVSNGTGITRSGDVQGYLRDQQLAGTSTSGLLQESYIEYYDWEKSLRNQYPEINIEKVSGKTKSKSYLGGHPAQKEFVEFFKKRSGIMHMRRIKEETEAAADIGEEMYLLECKVLKMEDGAEKDVAMKKLEELDKAWQYAIENVNSNYSMAPFAELDDRLAMRTPPYPRLQWDQRPFEPLIMRPDEVWPQSRLSLISAEPRPKPAVQDSDWFEWVQDFVYGLYTGPGDGINHALDKMQHGLSSIIKDCPSLRDPEKGGRLYMHHLRVRLLTMEMIEELVTAYKDWPFKAPGSDHNKYFRNKSTTQKLVGARA